VPRAKEKLRRPKPANSSARKCITFERANTARDRRSRPSPLACRRRDVRGWTCHRRSRAPLRKGPARVLDAPTSEATAPVAVELRRHGDRVQPLPRSSERDAPPLHTGRWPNRRGVLPRTEPRQSDRPLHAKALARKARPSARPQPRRPLARAGRAGKSRIDCSIGALCLLTGDQTDATRFISVPQSGDCGSRARSMSSPV
jgi:hypothetical protein